MVAQMMIGSKVKSSTSPSISTKWKGHFVVLMQGQCVYLSMPCASGIHLPIGFNKITVKCMVFIIIKMDLLDISRIKSNKLQTAIKISASNQ